MFENTKAFCDALLGVGVPGFDLIVCRGGETVLRYRGGLRDLENRIPVDGTERFNIYSCSKLITVTAALQLWERGLFTLEDALGDYLPEYASMNVFTPDGIKPAQHPIQIKHLFEMTAGLNYNPRSPYLLRCGEETGGRCPTREAVRYLAGDTLLFEPGARWHYSFCHDVLAALVEVLSGEKFETYVKKHIFDVAGMPRSTFLLPESEAGTIAPQYRARDGGFLNVGPHVQSFKLGSEYASGGAGCISTVDEYIRFLEALRTYKLLQPETVKLMTTPRVSEDKLDEFFFKGTHGYGLGVRCPNGDPHYADFGWDGAACSFYAVDETNAITLFFGTHVLSSPAQRIRTMLYRIVRADLLDPDDFPAIAADLERRHHFTAPF